MCIRDRRYAGAVNEHALPGPEGEEGAARGQWVSWAVRAAARAGAERRPRTLLVLGPGPRAERDRRASGAVGSRRRCSGIVRSCSGADGRCPPWFGER
eukprot:5373342-Alexandrium_andersonii.AAC.1